jgi:mRNA interferase RelE/StbE
MAKQIKVHQNAVKFLRELKKSSKNKIIKQIKKLLNDAGRKRLDIKKLKGTYGRSDLYRLKVGKYRVVFAIEKNIIYVTEIFHRERGYR